MPQNMYNLLIQNVLVNRKKYANACKSRPYLSDTSATSSSVSVCNSETIGDYPAHDSKTSVLMVHLAFAETVDSLYELRRELH
jgi:hypothetical protein